MFAMQGNNWIWILLAFFLLFGNDGCGFDFNLGNMFGCGTDSTLMIILLAMFLFNSGAMAC
ncbi:MAG: hypothetical protein GX366_02465 [Epulopiscium sp.]|nr:hypothetical protein [Candidatus Epulonipiscium sp.]